MLGLQAGRPAFCSKRYRLTVWRVAIGVCPCFLALTEGREIRELLLGNCTRHAWEEERILAE
jgi:hypothetical protein